MKSISAAEFRNMQNKPTNYKARGSVKAGKMNRLETSYSKHLEALQGAGEILWWKWDGINLRLGENCHYRPDFLVLKPDLSLEIHETKGYMQEDAAVKLKVAAASFPFRFVLVKWVKGAWQYTDY